MLRLCSNMLAYLITMLHTVILWQVSLEKDKKWLNVVLEFLTTYGERWIYFFSRLDHAYNEKEESIEGASV